MLFQSAALPFIPPSREEMYACLLEAIHQKASLAASLQCRISSEKLGCSDSVLSEVSLSDRRPLAPFNSSRRGGGAAWVRRPPRFHVTLVPVVTLGPSAPRAAFNLLICRSSRSPEEDLHDFAGDRELRELREAAAAPRRHAGAPAWRGEHWRPAG
jgi:hypothetical protein